MIGPRVRVPGGVLARCFWRSLFLQAAWNRRGMQNLGFAYAIDPALRALYREPERRREALARHLGFFNCHPYAAAAILGGTIHHEERVAVGLEPPGAPVAYKATLQGPLAAIGDGFFWTALRPLFGAIAAVGALLFGWPAVVSTLTIYNAIHLVLRIGFFRTGYRRGDEVVGAIARLSLPRLAERLRLAAAGVCGAAAALVAVRADVVPRSGSFLTAALVSALGYFALSRGAPLLPAAYVAIAVGVGLALVTHLYGSPF
ncbi:MAG TPA: PTS system mannose/fructose/sorbose family transporter subunit IID [Anaeromyxobacteraceae bacterium]|nr:PTS system mannose/fructose/sorbose family transporter subunit IID [Anaeromyxobacteraceae bacterium]